MKIKTAIKLGFVKGEDSFWRKRILQKCKDGVHRLTWQKYDSKTCEKCGEEYIASHRIMRFCSRNCFLQGNNFALGATYSRTNRPAKIIQHGYYWVLAPQHPNAIKDRIPEHRQIMEKKFRRILKSSECVHHINGNRLDNRIENLVVVTRSEHNAIHKSEEVSKRKRNTEGRFL